MEIIFKDTILNNRFNKFGYVIAPLINIVEINQLLELYNSTIQKKVKENLYESTSQNGDEINKLINYKSKKIFKRPLEELFQNYTYYGGAFLVKSPINSKELGLHQDWSYIDENKDTAIFLWTALQDTTKENGTMFIIDKSHTFFNLYRTGSYSSHKINRKLIPKEFITTINLKAGEALIMSPKLFHGSYANKCKLERIIATALLTTKDAPFYYYHRKNKSEVEIYSVDPKSYLDDIGYLANGKVPPTAKLIITRPYKYLKIKAHNMNKKLTNSYFPFLKIVKNFF
jgi:hypothetical protein